MNASDYVQSLITDENMADPYLALMILLGLVKTKSTDSFQTALSHPALRPETDVFVALVYAKMENTPDFAKDNTSWPHLKPRVCKEYVSCVKCFAILPKLFHIISEGNPIKDQFAFMEADDKYTYGVSIVRDLNLFSKLDRVSMERYFIRLVKAKDWDGIRNIIESKPPRLYDDMGLERLKNDLGLVPFDLLVMLLKKGIVYRSSLTRERIDDDIARKMFLAIAVSFKELKDRAKFLYQHQDYLVSDRVDIKACLEVPEVKEAIINTDLALLLIAKKQEMEGHYRRS